MTMFSGLEARSEMNELLDELYGGGTEQARPGKAREGRCHADRRRVEPLGGAQNRAPLEGHQQSSVEVLTRQECGEERKQITLLASNHEEEDRMWAEERHADEPKKDRGLVDKAVDKAREKGFIDKATKAVDKIKNRLTHR